jgi:transcription antitermination protein NusB
VSQQEARERAIGLLYAADAGELSQIESAEHEGRGFRLAKDTWAHLAEIDALLNTVSTEWRVGRMPAVDRAILRLAVYELRYTDTPVGVVLSEAVELAKEYSTADSGRFVNGVLAAIAAGDRAER